MEEAHSCLSHDVWHVVNERAQYKESALRGEDFKCLIALDTNLQVLLERPVSSLLLQPHTAGPHVDLCFCADKEDLQAIPIYSKDPKVRSIKDQSKYLLEMHGSLI